MAQPTTTTIAAERAEGRLMEWFSWAPFWKGMGAISLFYIIIRIYQQLYAWTMGLDFFSEEFRIYWWSPLIGEIILETFALTFVCAYLWKTRDRNLDRLPPEVELRRYWGMGMWVVVYEWAAYWGGSFFTEQDATWHQTTIRDNDFTPSHVVEFYLSYPIFIILGVGGILWGKTRLPQFSKGFSLPWLFAVAGPAMILVNVAFNEWGHTFWIMEELFAAPLHWGFVFFAWSLLGVWGVFVQIIPRIAELVGQLTVKQAA